MNEGRTQRAKRGLELVERNGANGSSVVRSAAGVDFYPKSKEENPCLLIKKGSLSRKLVNPDVHGLNPVGTTRLFVCYIHYENMRFEHFVHGFKFQKRLFMILRTDFSLCVQTFK